MSTLTRVLYVGFVVLAVGAAVWFMNRPDWQLVNITKVTGSVESDTLDVTVVSSNCNGGPRARVVTSGSDEVVVRAEQNRRGDCDDVAITRTLTVELSGELGDRRVRLEDRDGGATCRVAGSTTDPCR